MEPSFAQRNLTITQMHQLRVGGEVPSSVKVNMNKVSFLTESCMLFLLLYTFIIIIIYYYYLFIKASVAGE